MSTRDKLGNVLCHHGRPFSCGECGEEYAAEVDKPRASDARFTPLDEGKASGSATETSSSSPRPQEAQAEPPEITAPQLAAYMSDNPPAMIETDSPLWRDVIRLLTEQAERIRALEEVVRQSADRIDVATLSIENEARQAQLRWIVEQLRAALAQGLGTERTKKEHDDALTRVEPMDG